MKISCTARHFERPATSLSSERIFGLVVILAMWKCAETWKSLMKKLLSDKNMFFVNLAGTTHLGVCIQAEESTATCVFPFLLRMRRTYQIALPECLRPVIAIDHATCASWNSKLELGNQSHPSQRREADVFLKVLLPQNDEFNLTCPFLVVDLKWSAVNISNFQRVVHSPGNQPSL